MTHKNSRMRKKLRRLCTYSSLSYLIYCYRYLCLFTVIGFSSIVLEIALVQHAFPGHWPWLAKAIPAFFVGLTASFVLNATLNFRVPRHYLLATFARFVLVSACSFTLNMLAVWFLSRIVVDLYAPMRLASAGMLFLIVYMIHRSFTFHQTRNVGIALYASATQNVSRVFHRIGRNCDHIHVDLVDETMNPSSDPVDLAKLTHVRRWWKHTPVCLHVMSLYPEAWAEQTWEYVDWYMFHVGARDNLWKLIADCRWRGKKVGLVWQSTVGLDRLLPYLPHLDFVMVLGVAQPGRSGQPVLPEALQICSILQDLRRLYGYEVMFDGGVNLGTIPAIQAKYLVAASAVLGAVDPIRSAHSLRTSARYERFPIEADDPRPDLANRRRAARRAVRDADRKLRRRDVA